VDRISKEHRSWNMSRIKCRDTNPELVVRSILHQLGYRFRLHSKTLPGRPDIVLPKWRRVILVHGCFWHRHPGCKFAYTPKSRIKFWTTKFLQNVERDRFIAGKLRRMGWKVTIVWECQVQKPEHLALKLDRLIRNHFPHSGPINIKFRRKLRQ
jgi:DNA mismatch endonuclease (patch repair protein)